MWALNLVRNRNGEEEVEVKDMSTKENDTKQEEKKTFNLENIKNLLNEEKDDKVEVNHYRRHWGKYVCGVVLLGGGYLFYRSR